MGVTVIEWARVDGKAPLRSYSFVQASNNRVTVRELSGKTIGTFPIASAIALPGASVQLTPLYMMSEAIVNAQAQLAGVPPVGDTSLVVLEMRDCNGDALPGVRFESSFKDSVPFVIVDGAPTGDRTLTVRDESTNSAFALLPNIPPGFVFFDAYLGDDGPLLDQANVPIQPGSVTEVEFRPPYPTP